MTAFNIKHQDGDEKYAKTPAPRRIIVTGTPSVLNFSLTARNISERFIGAAPDTPSSSKQHGPERKGRGGKIKKW